MYVTVVAILCKLAVPTATLAADTDCTAEEIRVEEVMTDSTVDEFADFFGCMVHAQIGAAKWKAESALYRGSAWRIARIKCVPGRYELKGRA